MKKAIRVLYRIVGWMAVFTAILMLFVVGTQLFQSQEDEKNPHRSEEQILEELEKEADKDSTVVVENEKPEDTWEDTQEIAQKDTETEEAASEKEKTDEKDAFHGFTMTFVGDTYYNERRVSQYESRGVAGLLDDTLLGLMQTADIAVLNNECALSDGGEAMEDKEYTYRMTPSLSQSYVDMGIDLVTLANNHALDFGTEALEDTFETLDQYGIDYIGAGMDYERSKQAAVYDIDGKTVAVLAASRVIPVVEWNIVNRQPGMFCTYDSTALEAEIRACRELYDYVIVYVHWGIMETEQPVDYQREMAYRYVEAGADLVLGSHPHVVQSIEFYQGKPIYYSLGNFLYGSTIQRTMLVTLEADAEGKLASRIYPCYAVGGKTCVMELEKGKEFYRYMEEISYSVQIDDQGYIKESENGRSE